MSDKNNNTGKDNSGYENSGNGNSGDGNSGDRNSGDRNSGDRNSGNRNSGDWNSGDWNSGGWNSGDWNSGDWNSGGWNSGDWNSGFLCTDTPKVRIFNQETDLDRDEIEFPNYFFFELNEWIQEEAMSNEEKEENPEYETTGGYLKAIEYKDAWRRAWDNADLEDRKKTLKLPNWNNELFLEITGIDVEKELKAKKIIKINGKKKFEREPHAEQCPVCGGSGEKPKYLYGYPQTTSTNFDEVCHGCGGKGWVVV